MGQLPLECDAMRELVSASLDGELSELETVRLEAHLSSCRACTAYAASARETSRLLRATPLEDLSHPIVLPRRRLAVARKLQFAAAAAAVAVIAGLSAAVGTVSQAPRTQARTTATPSNLRFPDQELRMLQRALHARASRTTHSRIAL
jgi:predicted anti-sigma-YlaC factor YlaD